MMLEIPPNICGEILSQKRRVKEFLNAIRESQSTWDFMRGVVDVIHPVYRRSELLDQIRNDSYE